MEQQYKKCSGCKETKSISEFYKNEIKKDGLSDWCKDCQKKYMKGWRKINREKIKENCKKYREENKDKIKECNQKYYKRNKDKRNKDKMKESRKKWREKNKENIRKYRKNRRKIDSLYKLSEHVRTTIFHAFKNKGYTKKSKTYNILGIGYDEFYKWLNSEASNGLSYEDDNVNIDHVIPVSLAQTKEEVLMLNHYSNLQLLSSKDNFSKHDRYINEGHLNRVLEYHPNPDKLNEIINKNNVKIIEKDYEEV